MKKSIFFIAIVFSGMLMQAQDLYQLDTVLIADGKSKSEIYNAIKSGISELYNNPNYVIKYDNATEGKIIVKGTQNSISYDFTFLMKDEKYRIISKPMYCDAIYYEGFISENLNRQDVRVIGYSKKKNTELANKVKQFPKSFNSLIIYTMNKSVNNIQQVSDW